MKLGTATVGAVSLPDWNQIKQRWLDHSISKNKTFELSAGVIATTDSVSDKKLLYKNKTTVLETVGATYKAEIRSDDNDVLLTWAEYWAVIATEMLSKIAQMSEGNDQGTDLGSIDVQKASASKAIHSWLLTGTPSSGLIQIFVAAVPKRAFALPRQGLSRVQALSNVTANGQLVIGSTSIEAKALSTIEIGSWFVLEQSVVYDACECQFRFSASNRTALPIRWHLIEGTLEMMTDSNTQNSTPSFSTNGGGSELSVPIYAFIELKEVELDKLMQLEANSILKSDVFANGITVKISTSSKVVAEGQLVQIDDRLAVRVLKTIR
jgi:Type III flagellar switch regulator (C-ring) FliN C-term